MKATIIYDVALTGIRSNRSREDIVADIQSVLNSELTPIERPLQVEIKNKLDKLIETQSASIPPSKKERTLGRALFMAILITAQLLANHFLR
jgi:hypothetical protein